MGKHIRTAVFMFVFILLLPAAAHADSSSLFRSAGTVEMVSNDNVRMAEENVYVKSYGGISVVRCEFLFENDTASSQDVLMGFPASLIGEGLVLDPSTRLYDFKVLVNGTPCTALLESAGKKDGPMQYWDIAEWYTWNVSFLPGESKTVVNTYIASSYNAPWARNTGYILKTGAPWKGTIGKALVTFEFMDISPSKLNSLTTPGYSLEQNRVIWEMHDFEPQEDISLSLTPGYTLKNIQLAGKSDDVSTDILKKLSDVQEMVVKGNKEQGINAAKSMLESGMAYEELYFYLLNYYREAGDMDAFIRTLKEEASKLNSLDVYEWAYSLYPERLEAEGISRIKPHEPVLKGESIVRKDEGNFEITFDIYDEAADVTSAGINYSTDSLNSTMGISSSAPQAPYGKQELTFRYTGSLPPAYGDLLVTPNITHYYGLYNTRQWNVMEDLLYFYSGESFEKWNILKYENFTLCCYDSQGTRNSMRLAGMLSNDIEALAGQLGIRKPEGGYVINVYGKEHFPNITGTKPQLITRKLKSEIIKSGSAAAEASELGEICIASDSNPENMEAAVIKNILAAAYGNHWLDAGQDFYRDFMAALKKTPSGNDYYKTLSLMQPAELANAAAQVGSTGSTEAYTPIHRKNYSRMAWIIAGSAAAAGLLIGGLVFRAKKVRQP